MGVCYRGVLCVGYTYEEAETLYEKCTDDNGDYKYEDFYDFCENVGLTSYSPYYDANKEDCIYGDQVVSSDDYSYEVVAPNLDLTILEITNKLEKEFSIRPKVYIMANGW